MKIIEKEIEILKKNIENSFTDPLQNELKNFLLKGSKYIRSTIAILYLKAQNIDINNDIYNILTAGEIIHNASLLHDDVIDNANTRRGNTTIAKKFTSNISILAGDFLLSHAIEKLLELKNFEILNIFKNCTKNMSCAEIKQYFFQNSIPTKEQYIEICKNKTAELFSTILESCSIITNLEQKKAKDFGILFGICFQINNDLNKESAKIDKLNGIYTAKDVLGIENTELLLDNYKEKMENLIKDFPENIYKESLKDLINSL